MALMEKFRIPWDYKTRTWPSLVGQRILFEEMAFELNCKNHEWKLAKGKGRVSRMFQARGMIFLLRQSMAEPQTRARAGMTGQQ